MTQGLLARQRAAEVLEAVLVRARPLDDALDLARDLPGQDRGFVHALVATTLRRLGSIDAVLASRLDRGLPDGLVRLKTLMRLGIAQVLFLDTAAHAAVDTTVAMVTSDRKAKGFAGLANAVLRGIARDKAAGKLAERNPRALVDLPEPWRSRWLATYGADQTAAMAQALRQPSPLDLTVKSDPAAWAKRLGGHLLPTGSVRLAPGTAVTSLEGYDEGAWWVQDAAAAIPAKLFGNIAGKHVLDVCAAPGGKTAQLAVAGAKVTAVDRSGTRLGRLAENMARLNLDVDAREADAATIEGTFEAVLLDAPCTATGTARGNPDVLHLKSEKDIEGLGRMQMRLLNRLADWLTPGGQAVYCTCSLEPEEGEMQIAALLSREPRLRLSPIVVSDAPGLEPFIGKDGTLRTLPCHWPRGDMAGAGLDGFFAARLVRV